MIEICEKYLETYKEIENSYVQKIVSIIGSPLAAGQSRGGVELSCNNLRELGLHDVIKSLCWNYEDIGNISVDNEKNYGQVNIEVDNKEEKKDTSKNISNECHNVTEKCTSKKYFGNDYYNNIKNIEYIGKFSEKLFDTMSNEIKKKHFVLNIGGDHSVAYASILSTIKNYSNLKVIWIDAHADINTPETSPSGNYHGMSLAHSLKFFQKKVPNFEWSESLNHLKMEDLAIIGLRDVDKYEKIILKKNNINYYTIFDIEKNGIYKIISDALQKIDPNQNCPIHISLDIDSVDPVYAPATGTIARGGLSYREINFLMKFLADTKRVVSMDLVEYNPTIDEKDENFHGDSLPISQNATKTGKLCLELIAKVLGNDIV